MPPTSYRWVVLVWRLPTGVSTPRVTAWRRLKRLGAFPLTPGAAAVAYSEELHEHMDWIAEDITDWGGDAWVLPVGALSQAEEARIAAIMARTAMDPRKPSRYASRRASVSTG